MQALFETLFDIVYLTTVITLGIRMVRRSEGSRQFLLFGIMAIVLGLGDSFHLLPRAVALNTYGLDHFVRALGLGKLITSVTMTLFYVLLYYVWRSRYQVTASKGSMILMGTLAVIRIALSLLPQNQWVSVQPSFAWGIYRNIPFALMGLITIYLFYTSARDHHDEPFRRMWLTIALSFAFYFPVVLWGDTVPLIGILMIPKTCAYVWTVWIGYSDMKSRLPSDPILAGSHR